MTKPDAMKNKRNVLLAVSFVCAGLSFGAVRAMSWWVAPLDYWFMWASIFAGLIAIGTGICGIAMHFERIDSLRSN